MKKKYLNRTAENTAICQPNVKNSPHLKPDWPPIKVYFELRKKGLCLPKAKNGILHDALHRPCPTGEWAIATYLGLEPPDIWPSRYRYDYNKSEKYLKDKSKYGQIINMISEELFLTKNNK
ncbi:helix-turn-helix domain-containing protein [Xenorhabdus bovienii]|uniref:Putative phage protein n=1 Tax=Xenorhabdus bovienii TaxID=40576 RepID=A0A0B6XF12_XENBV|nr:helix-turn-helix domain-containing protein [Xenorhabdus bovienii]CDM92170.1 Putative phage protein [Xenorhabdus bovienii]